MSKGGRVLIVEDEVMIGFALEDMLDSLGWSTVAVASKLAQALKLAEAASLDAAILDVNLHGDQSYPVADVLVERNVPFIFATGYGDSQHPERYRDVVTLTKPYTRETVRLALEQLTSTP